MGLVEEGLRGPTVFRDLAKLDFDYVPDELPGREDELRRLTALYRGLSMGAVREHALLWGPVGTGKTALAKRFARDFSAGLAKQGRRLEWVHVNCRKHKTSGLALLWVLNQFDPNYPERGFPIGQMLRDLRRVLERRQAHLLIVLDEVDALLDTEGSNLVYDLTRFNDDAAGSWHGVSLLLVSQRNVLGDLDKAALSTFKQTNTLEIRAYETPQLEAIVQQRVRLAFVPATVDPDTAMLVADLAAAEGNARLAIEVLQKAGMIADDEGSSRVLPDHVRAAKAESHSYITTAKLQALPRHVLLALLGLARRLAREEAAYATTGQAESAYKVACEEFGETPRAHTQYWKYLNQLQGGGFIVSRQSGRGQAGTTQYLSIPDAPARQVEAKVMDLLRAPT